MDKRITYAAMDAHKKQHRVALVYPNDEVIVEFSVKNTPAEIRKMVRRIKKNAVPRKNLILAEVSDRER